MLFSFLLKLGGPGLLILGVLDSSFLFAPFGNDLLLVALTARHPRVGSMLYYAGMSTIGSLLGTLLIDLTLRPLGARGLEHHLGKRRVKRVQARVEKNAGLALAIASLAPPPFPFTPFLMAAAALQYSRTRLLAVVGAARLGRFVVFGSLALLFGKRILKWAQNHTVQEFLIGLTVLCIIGSIVSVYGWIARSRTLPAVR